MSDLWHYTCADHGRAALGQAGLLKPASALTDRPMPWMSELVWLTDLSRPDRNALGLTSNFAFCDRTAHRYRVTDARDVVPWTRFARHLSRADRDDLELAPGARPSHWFVSVRPVPAVLDEVAA